MDFSSLVIPMPPGFCTGCSRPFTVASSKRANKKSKGIGAVIWLHRSVKAANAAKPVNVLPTQAAPVARDPLPSRLTGDAALLAAIGNTLAALSLPELVEMSEANARDVATAQGSLERLLKVQYLIDETIQKRTQQ
jgi:hypothetical protein